MKIFVSYAAEHLETARELAHALNSEGHDVFFDRDELRPGETFYRELRQQLERSDALVFLIGPQSVAEGAFTRTELRWVESRWPRARRRVLPVEVEAVPMEQIPSYLRSVSLLKPSGNVVAETLAVLAEWSPQEFPSRLVPAVTSTTLGWALAEGLGWWVAAGIASRSRGLGLAVGSVVTALVAGAAAGYALRIARPTLRLHWVLALMAGWSVGVPLYGLVNDERYGRAIAGMTVYTVTNACLLVAEQPEGARGDGRVLVAWGAVLVGHTALQFSMFHPQMAAAVEWGGSMTGFFFCFLAGAGPGLAGCLATLWAAATRAQPAS